MVQVIEGCVIIDDRGCFLRKNGTEWNGRLKPQFAWVHPLAIVEKQEQRHELAMHGAKEVVAALCVIDESITQGPKARTEIFFEQSFEIESFNPTMLKIKQKQPA